MNRGNIKKIKDIFLLENQNSLRAFFIILRFHIKYYFRSYTNVFFGIVIIGFILTMWLLFSKDNYYLVVASAVSLSIVRNTSINFYNHLAKQRQTLIFRRIQYFPVNKYVYVWSLFVFSFLLNIFNIVLLILYSLIYMDASSIVDVFSRINWWMFISGLLILWITCILIGLWVYLLIKNDSFAFTILILNYVLIMNFMGLSYPIENIIEKPILNYFLYIIPERYIINIIQAGWVGASNMIFEKSPDCIVDFGFGGKIWIPYLVTIIFIVIMSITIAIYSDKHQEVGYGVGTRDNLSYKNSRQYIKSIKRAKSFQQIEELRDIHLDKTKY